MWGSEPQGKAFQRTKTRKGEPGLQPLISKLAEAGPPTHQLPPADLHREGEGGTKGWGWRTSLNEGSRGSPGKGQWGQMLNTASVPGGGTDSGRSVREKKKQQTQKTTLLFYSMEHPL